MLIIIVLLSLLFSQAAFAANDIHHVLHGGAGTKTGADLANAFGEAEFNTASNWDTDVADDNKIGPGDTVYFYDNGGDFAGVSTTGVLTVQSSGTSGNPITFSAYPGETPVIDSSGYRYGFYVYGGNMPTPGNMAYINIDGLTVKNSDMLCVGGDNNGDPCNETADCSSGGGYCGGGYGFQLVSTATRTLTHVNVSNCIAHTNQGHGFKVSQDVESGTVTTQYVTLTNCTAYDNGEAGGDQQAHGFQVSDGTGDITISNCTSYGNDTTWGCGFRFGETVNGTLENSVSYGNYTGVAIQGSESQADNITVKNCYIHTNTTAGIDLGEADDVHIEYNLITNNAYSGIRFLSTADHGPYYIYNNTLAGNNTALGATYLQLGIYDSDTANVVIDVKNNIFYHNAAYQLVYVQAGSDTTNYAFNYNLYYSTSTNIWFWLGSYYNLAGVQGLSQELNGNKSDPLFVSATDFHLSSTSSPAIDKGDNLFLASDYSGRAVPYDVIGTSNADNGTDIGAFEYPALYWVRPVSGEYMTEDGLQYNSAYDGFADISWSAVDLGNGTLYVAGTHREVVAPTASGEDGAPIILDSYVADPGILLGTLNYDDDAEWEASGTANVWRTTDTFATDIGQLIYNTNTTPVFGTNVETTGALDTDWEFLWNSADSKVYVFDDSGNKPSVDANGLELSNPACTDTQGIISLVSDDWITIRNLTLMYGHSIGIRTANSADNDVIDNCIIRYIGGREWDGTEGIGNGIQIDWGTTNLTVSDNIVSDAWDVCISNESTASATDATSGITISGNTVYNCPSVGILVNNSTGGAYTISNVTISNNIAYANDGTTLAGKPTSNTNNPTPYLIGCYTNHATETVSGLVIQNNHVYDCTNAGMIFWGCDATVRYNSIHDFTTDGIYSRCRTDTNCDNDIDVYYNLIYNAGDNGIRGWATNSYSNSGTFNIYNNTIESDGTQAGFDACIKIDQNTTNVTAKNNILYSTTAYGLFVSNTGVTTSAFSNDLYYKGVQTNAAYYKGSAYATCAALPAGVEDVCVDDDPLFVSAGTDFHLTSTSPAKDVGTNVSLTSDFSGRTVPYNTVQDIGAFEYPALYWVRPISGEYMTEDGLQYNSAYDGFADIVWADVDLGNGTLYVAGTHREQLAVGESGEVGVPIVIQSYAADPAILLGSQDYDSASWTQVGATNVWRTADNTFTTDVGMIYYNTNATIGFGKKYVHYSDFIASATNWDYWWDWNDSEDVDGVDDCIYVYHTGGAPNTVADGLEIATDNNMNQSPGLVAVVVNSGEDYVTVDGLSLRYFNTIGIYGGKTNVTNYTVQNCDLRYGGGKWNGLDTLHPIHTRIGNAISIDNNGSAIIFQNNYAEHMYDTCWGLETFNSSDEAITNVTIDSNRCSNAAWGFNLWISSTNNGTDNISTITVSNNTFDNIGSPLGLSRSTDACGIQAADFDDDSTTSNITFSNNTVNDSIYYGIRAYGLDGPTTISRNIVKDTTYEGIKIEGDTNTSVLYNLVYNTLNSGIRALNCYSPTYIYNNTIDAHGTYNDGAGWPGCIRIGGASTEAITVKNNILYSDSCRSLVVHSDTGVNPTLDYNLYENNQADLLYFDGTSYASLTAFKAAHDGDPNPIQEANGVESDPLFHTAGSNFYITSTSPAIDKGLNLQLPSDIQGTIVPYDVPEITNADNGTDIGAFEFPSSMFVRPAGTTYGSGNGTSYENAYSGFSGIDWGAVNSYSCAKLYVCGTHREQLDVGTSGSVSKQIIIESYPADPATILGSEDADSASVWSDDPVPANVWRYTVSRSGDVGNVWYDTNATISVGTKISEANCPGSLDSNGDFCWEDTADTLYVYSDGGVNPATRWNGIEVPKVLVGSGGVSDDVVVRLAGKDYITIDGLTVKYANGTGIRAWYTAGAACDHVNVQNCSVSYSGGKDISTSLDLSSRFGNGIDILGSASYITFDNNSMFQIWDTGIGAETGNSGTAQSYITFSDNTVDKCGIGLSVWAAIENSTFSNIIVSGNTVKRSGQGFSGDTEQYSNGGHFQATTSGSTVEIIVERNYFTDNGDDARQDVSYGPQFVAKGSGINMIARYNLVANGNGVGFRAVGNNTTDTPTALLYYNIFYNNEMDEIRVSCNAALTLYNNVLFDSGSDAFENFRISDGFNNITFNNNIFYSTSSYAFYDYNTSPSWTADNNLYYRATGDVIKYTNNPYTIAQFASYQSAAHGNPKQDANSLAINPLFVSSGDKNFQLEYGAPTRNLARDAGKNVHLSYDYAGKAVDSDPDIGAFNGDIIYYVRPSGGTYQFENGMSYRDAIDGIQNISWSALATADASLYVAGTHREQLVIAASGEVDKPLIVQSYSADPAFLLGSEDYDTDVWTEESTNVWKTADSTFAADTGMVYYNTNSTIGFGNKEWYKSDLNAQWDFWYDSTNDCVYVYSAGSPDYMANGLEIATDNVTTDPNNLSLVVNKDYNYITIDGLNLRYYNTHGINMGQDSVDNIIVQNNDIRYGGGKLQGVLGGYAADNWQDMGGNVWKNNTEYIDRGVESVLDGGAGMTRETVTPTTPGSGEYGISANSLYVNHSGSPGASHVTINYYVQFGNAIEFDGNSSHVTIQDNTVAYDYDNCISLETFNADEAETIDSILIQNNQCTKTYYNIETLITSQTGTYVDTISNVTIQNNDLTDAECPFAEKKTSPGGIRLFNNDSEGIHRDITIQDNTINGSENYGIWLFRIDNVDILRNSIINTDGISLYLQQTNDINIRNNLITSTGGAYNNAESAIYVNTSDDIYIYNNTAISAGEIATDFDAALKLDTSNATVVAKNNILSGGSTAFALFQSTTPSEHPLLDYNLYYSTATNGIFYGHECGGSDVDFYAIPSAWSTFKSEKALCENPEANSPTPADPKFMSATDLRLKNSTSPAVNAGYNLGTAYSLALDPQNVSGPPYSAIDQNSYAPWEIGAFVHRGYFSGTAKDWNGSTIRGISVYYICYELTGTGGSTHAALTEPIAITTSNAADGTFTIAGVDTGTEYLCVSQYYGTYNNQSKVAGAEFITAK